MKDQCKECMNNRFEEGTDANGVPILIDMDECEHGDNLSPSEWDRYDQGDCPYFKQKATQ